MAKIKTKKEESQDGEAAAPAESNEPKAAKPVVSKNFVDPLTNEQVTLAHDPNDGSFVETRVSDGKTTITKHKVFSHAFARLIELKK